MTPDPADSIRAAGLRVTSQRLAVLEALTGLPHADTETVHRVVQNELPDITVQSVYVVLAALTEAQLIRRIEPAGSPALYERRIGDNHHHAICSVCGAVQDVDCVMGQAPCLTPSEAGGFVITTAEVTFWGLCAECQRGMSPLNVNLTPESMTQLAKLQGEEHMKKLKETR